MELKNMKDLVIHQLTPHSIRFKLSYKFQEFISKGVIIKVFGGTGTEQVNNITIDNVNGLKVPIDAKENVASIEITRIEPFRDYLLEVSAYSDVGVGESDCWDPITAKGMNLIIQYLFADYNGITA